MRKLILVIVMVVFSNLVHAQTASAPINYSNKSNITIDGKYFNSGTSGAAIYLTSCNNVVITNCTFSLNSGIIGVQLSKCSNVEITGCYFENVNSGVYAINCTGGINIHCNAFKNIAGAKPRGQVVQFNTCAGAGNRINYNTLDYTYGSGNPEDLVNMYASSGTVADPIQIIGNQFRGGGPSTSGGGIMLGDNGSHDIRCEDNILVDVGQYGISAPSGYNLTIINNKVYGSKKTWTNVGIYVGLQSEITAGYTCAGSTIQVKNNLVNFTNKNGVVNGWYNCSCCSGVVQSGNDFKSTITSAVLPSDLSLNTTQCSGISTSTNEIIKDQATFHLYPNPVNQQLKISSFEVGGEILIFNTIGEVVFAGNANAEALLIINVEHLGSGLYFVKINNEIQKFIKE
ncbi:MAG: right-handed parallel beta-helix repeat-containing protein [Flavobacteriales bacterium]